MFRQRLLSGIVMVIVLVLTVGIGGYLLFGVALVVSLIGMSELYHVEDVREKLIGFIGYAAAIAYYILLLLGRRQDFMALFILFLMAVMAVYVFTYPTYRSHQVMTVFFGLFYVAVMLSYIYQTRMLEDGSVVVWLIFLSSWGCDTCAYCVGMLIGKHKMTPRLSPKKSIEGAIGGIAGAALLGLLFAVVMNNLGLASASVPMYALICGVGAVIAQIGDLAASAIKRNHDIKDYGHLIPGHGGILDRFDSVIFTAPAIYYLAVWLSGIL